MNERFWMYGDNLSVREARNGWDEKVECEREAKEGEGRRGEGRRGPVWIFCLY